MQEGVSMKKIQKIIIGTVLAIIMVSFTSSISLAADDKDKVIKWRGQGFVPAGMLFHEAFVRIADEIKKVTNGRLIIDVNPPGTFVPPLKGLKAVSDNVYQVNFSYSALWIGDMQTAPLFTSVPGGFNPNGMNMWIEQGGGKELWQEMYDRKGYNVKLLPAGMLPMENFMWSKKPVRTIEDMKGLKMRMMPLMGEVLQANGLSVYFIPAGEIMPNLQRGVIDAAEYSIPSFDKTMGLWEVCDNVVVPGVHQPSSNLELVINKDAWNALPDELKSQVKAAVGKMRFENELWMRKKDMEAVEFFKEKGINFTELEPQAIETLIEWSNNYLDSLAKKDEFFAKVWKSQKEFSKLCYPHNDYYNLTH
jgi:TRAP-type mannitol/chloroaromatic compound transport system substrate-binding protein